MDLSIPAETTELTARMRAFLEERVYPLEPRFLREGFGKLEPDLKALRAEVKRLGMWAPQAPRDVGGMGLTLMQHAFVSEALGRSPLGHYVFGAHAPDAGNLEILHKYGTPEQREKWLLPLARGDHRSCFSMTEPGTPGSNPTQLETTARREGGDYVIDGRKWFTTAADGAAFAVVMAVTNPSAPPHLRASQIIVPSGTPGFRIVRNIPCMGHEGDGWASHAEVAYENCRVPVTNLLGPEGKGFLIAQERLGPGRIHHCMRWMGICERAFELLCRRAVSRKIDETTFLAEKQIVQAWIAEARAEIDAARWMILDAAWKIDRGGFAEAAESISLVKFHAAGVMLRVVDRAIQVHGALGITSDTVLAFFYAQERAARIYDGPDEVHKVAAARKILKRYQAG